MEALRVPGRNELLVGTLAFALLGALAMCWLQGSGLTSPSRYHTDLTQEPNWFAFHGHEFPDDDLLRRYASFNESPLQNSIYWLGTLAVSPVAMHKIVGIAIFALTAALFFALTSSVSGLATGALAASLFIIFPRGTYDIAGGFSKAWAIGFTLVAVYAVETRRFSLLCWTMPIAALAYPISPVLMGAIALAGVLLELRESRAEFWRGLRYLSIASALALVPLLYKYLNPLPGVGRMLSPSEMRAMAEQDEVTPLLPLWREILNDYIGHPFFIYGFVLILMLSARTGLVWKRSWTALVLGSAVAFQAAALVVPRIYLPDRYSRFSAAVLLVLWFAHNTVRVAQPLSGRFLRGAVFAGVVLFAALSFTPSFRPCRGDKAQGIWENEDEYARVSAAIREQPAPVFVAGHPNHTAQVLVQAARPVLTINRMYHAWYEDFRATSRQRILDTFAALYARRPADVNRLVERYGVTHLVVDKAHYSGARFREGRMYRNEFTEFIKERTRDGGPFALDPPPPDAVVYEDARFWLVRLPLATDDTPRP